MSEVNLVTILMQHINPSAKAQTAAQQSGGANANEDAGKLMSVAPQMIQDKVSLSGGSGGGSAKASALYSAAGQGGGQGQQPVPQISPADLATLAIPGRESSKPPDPSALATLAVPIGKNIDMKA